MVACLDRFTRRAGASAQYRRSNQQTLSGSWIPAKTLPAGHGQGCTCEVCGNEYDKVFEVNKDGTTHVFDCFECAIQALAPQCANCNCRIIGHGMEAGGEFYCCAHC
jgi:hypothetical protein